MLAAYLRTNILLFFYINDIVVLAIKKYHKYLKKFKEALQNIYNLKVIGPLL